MHRCGSIKRRAGTACLCSQGICGNPSSRWQQSCYLYSSVKHFLFKAASFTLQTACWHSLFLPFKQVPVTQIWALFTWSLFWARMSKEYTLEDEAEQCTTSDLFMPLYFCLNKLIISTSLSSLVTWSHWIMFLSLAACLCYHIGRPKGK